MRHLPKLPRAAHLVDPALRAAIRELVSGSRPWPLFVHGPAGAGKTSAALALCDHVPGLAVYWTASGWADALIQAGKGNLSERPAEGGCSYNVTPDRLRDRVSRAALVVLDELATRDRVSDWHYEAVKDLIDRRMGKPLMVCSNLSLESVDGIYDDRIADRLAGGTVVALTGASRRGEWRKAK